MSRTAAGHVPRRRRTPVPEPRFAPRVANLGWLTDRCTIHQRFPAAVLALHPLPDAAPHQGDLFNACVT